jgi:hypothetical protein
VESLPSKRKILKKREKEKKERKRKRKREKRSKDWKAKEVKPHMKLHVSKGEKKKKEDEIYKLLGKILSKERKKGDHIFL